MTTPRVVLRPKRAQPFYARHPWVFAGAIAAVSGQPQDGDEVEVVSHAGHFIARGLFNSQSKIRVRLYCWEPDRPLDDDFFREKLQRAIRFRHQVLELGGPEAACRLVFSEADGLSGLTVDRYASWLVVQFTALGIARRQDRIAALLRELTGCQGIYLRTERAVGKLEGLVIADGPLWGPLPEGPVIIDDGGLRWHVNLSEGQKTGFYLDQRDNRLAVARLASGRRVLDAFCYSGGFALQTARAGAQDVLAVDVSEAALDLGRANACLNALDSVVTFQRDDVFDRLTALAAEGRRFDMVVLDPPKFARARHAIPDALRGYRRLQTLGMQLLDRDGILVVCCCSGLISVDMLDDLLAQVATEGKRDVQIMERRGAARDHPINVACPETGYLKCLICRVL